MTEGSWVDQQREGLNNDEGESVKKRRPKPSNWEGLNIFKQGKAPVEKPDDEYPEWIWDLARPQRTRTELMKEAELAFRQGGEEEVRKRLTQAERSRLFKIANKQRALRQQLTAGEPNGEDETRLPPPEEETKK
eukprot:CAMPEP_0113961732 /NCGR_PEP_ID=MMETSP0011_2-20120614/5491_1 /TAXON_ID=101924 /ORGANISM="Rhodosorus marinus" /LENGTH=133 /DNA_ID=CAMNT_0000973443 /DNA_START=287 /DNA_END=688 /DNA_ORIENTATION=+ /assembly_acc=CAM_ASM_000156